MSEAVHTVTYLEVAPTAAAEVAQFLRLWSDAARKTAGNTRFEALQRIAPAAHHFAFVARWASRAAYDAARDGAAGEALRGKVAAHLICGIDTRIHGGLIGGADAGRGQGRVRVVTHVDVPPPHKDACIALLEAVVAASRTEAGCARLEVFQQADRPNHFSVVESWTDQGAWESHIVAGHTRHFRMQLTPISGALYDERIYAAIG